MSSIRKQLKQKLQPPDSKTASGSFKQEGKMLEIQKP